VARYLAGGVAGLLDHSSRPRRSPRRLPSSAAERVLELRRGHTPGYEIAHRTGMIPASVSRILRWARLSPWRDLNLPPVQRYDLPRLATYCIPKSKASPASQRSPFTATAGCAARGCIAASSHCVWQIPFGNDN